MFPSGRDKLRRERAQAVGISFCEARFDRQIFAVDETEFAQSVAKWRDGRVGALVRRGDKSDARDPHGLRPGRERPRGHRAAERGDEIAPPHSVSVKNSRIIT
jgi:hypothetical protein